MMKNICPVCKKYEYKFAIGSSEICNECGWEDDAVQRLYPDFKPGANKMSLNEARTMWTNNNLPNIENPNPKQNRRVHRRRAYALQ